MTPETTRPTPTGTLADLASAIEALAYLQRTFPTLPTLHVILLHNGASLDLQANSPDAFEQWRTALQIPPAAVELHAYYEGAWLHAVAAARGIATILTGHGLPITADQARTEQDPDGIRPTAAITVTTLPEAIGDAA
ncbi:hypothetical protein ACGFZA_31905 [Streptomyces sp. NPDC048211]|uniref:hypothetical protein n=1 Tax=Streptomyces sp. NPDC048211 TaxID=3365516 RepID=UPI00372263CB